MLSYGNFVFVFATSNIFLMSFLFFSALMVGSAKDGWYFILIIILNNLQLLKAKP